MCVCVCVCACVRTRWHSWLRHCAKSRMVAGSIPDGVIGSGVDSASNGNEYEEYFLGSKGGRCVELTILPPSCADCLEIVRTSTSWRSRACPCLYSDAVYYGICISNLASIMANEISWMMMTISIVTSINLQI
jgi:hypothetical protein